MAGAAELSAYRKVDVETASQGKLIVMLFNGAIQRAEEAKRQMGRGKIVSVHNNLLRAQAIIGELRNALNMKAGGEIARNLDRIYEYLQHLLIEANIQKQPQPIDDAIAYMTTMRDTWQELFLQLAKDQQGPAAPPVINAHGAALLNMQG